MSAPAMVRTTMTFGTRERGGGALAVSPAAWQQFLVRHVTPLFPAGLTWWEANGQWSGSDGRLVHEKALVLVLIHEATPQRENDVRSIANVYATMFSQESVMVECQPTTVAFLP